MDLWDWYSLPVDGFPELSHFTIVNGKIVEVEIIADPARLQQLDLAVLDG